MQKGEGRPDMDKIDKAQGSLAVDTIAPWDHLRSRSTFISRGVTLEMVVRLSFAIPGNIVEFGVADGTSTRIIRRVASACEKDYSVEAKKEIYACDSFEGLREKFENAEVGAFKTEPPIIPGVNIVKGYFEDSLTDDLAREVGTVSFASLDADLYSSTLCALNWLTPMLRSGSLLLFDEFLGEKESEKRAFEQWSNDTGTKTLMIAEFVRRPSGWGSALDRRTLFQVIGDDELVKHIRNPDIKNPIQRRLRRYPTLYNAVRSVYRLVS